MSNLDREHIGSVVKHITSTLKADSERLKANFTFIPREDDDPDTIALAIEQILAKYFKIITPSAILSQLNAGHSANFIDDSIGSLPPRTINILIQKNIYVFTIQGVPAVDGRDGYSELFYAWKKEAGNIDEIGNIDLKRTNAFSGVIRGDHLATIYLKTEGSPGISSDGKKIKQLQGKSFKVKWNEHAIVQSINPEDETQYFLHAGKTGLVLGTLLKKDDPRTLSSITIQESISVKGDVDYAIGDQGVIDGRGPECNFSLDITGDVRGAFSLHSNGFIHVKGVMEGKSVVAEEIEANIITGNCAAIAKNSLKAQSIVNASAQARFISVAKNASGSKLQAGDLITFEKGANCVGVTIETQGMESINNNFSGRTTINLGVNLFTKHSALKKQIKKLTQQSNGFNQPNKDIALALLTDIARIENIAKKNQCIGEKEIFAIIAQLKSNFSVAVQTAGKRISDKQIPLCYKLQEKLGDNNFHESVLVKVESLVGRIKKYNETATELRPIMTSLQEKNKKFQEVGAQIQNGLKIHLIHPKMIGPSAALLVRCGQAEKLFTAQELNGKVLDLTYTVPADEEDILNGKITLKSA